MKNLEVLLTNLKNEDASISDDDYNKWKEYYETLSEHEKIDKLFSAITQYLTSSSSVSSSVLASAIICTNRWINEKNLEDF